MQTPLVTFVNVSGETNLKFDQVCNDQHCGNVMTEEINAGLGLMSWFGSCHHMLSPLLVPFVL